MSKSKKTITVKLLKSSNSCTERVQRTLYGLGLFKVNATKVLEDTAATRGMVKKVHHLVEVIN